MPFSDETTTRSYLLEGFEDERIVNLSFEKYVKSSYEYDNFPSTTVTQYFNASTGSGSGAFWITPEEKAWLEIDLGVYACQVKVINILWTSKKYAPKFTIYTSEGPYKPWKKVADESTVETKHHDDILDWTTDSTVVTINEASVGTRKVKLEMEGGKVSWVDYTGIAKGFKLTRYIN
jgi:hypothetical protein